MKKIVLLFTVLTLLCGLCGCNVTPNPQENPVGDKTAFTRRFVSIPHEAPASTAAALTVEDTLTVFDKHTKDNNTWTAVLSQFDLTNQSERALYTATYVYGTDPEPVVVCRGGKDTVWVIRYTEGDLMYGGTTPSHHSLCVADISTGATLRE
ncbi:MAG: hypothetical protein E7552_05490 [Ruminococcaceae bacterium]|nr:hypothetical protein [Oscillospiraceae bacterium]